MCGYTCQVESVALYFLTYLVAPNVCGYTCQVESFALYFLTYLVAPDSVQATTHGGDTAVLRVIEAYCLGSRMKQASSE